MPFLTSDILFQGPPGPQGPQGPSGGGGGGNYLIPLINNQGPPSQIAVQAYNGGQQFKVPVGTVIGHINISCEAYNATDAAAHHLDQYSTLDANGLGGGTFDFGIMNDVFSGSAPFSLGSVVIPDSPQSGPYIVSATTTVGSPYTVLSGDNVVVTISAVSGTATQWLAFPTAYVGP